jgi:hypothetical protein
MQGWMLDRNRLLALRHRLTLQPAPVAEPYPLAENVEVISPLMLASTAEAAKRRIA